MKLTERGSLMKVSKTDCSCPVANALSKTQTEVESGSGQNWFLSDVKKAAQEKEWAFTPDKSGESRRG